MATVSITFPNDQEDIEQGYFTGDGQPLTGSAVISGTLSVDYDAMTVTGTVSATSSMGTETYSGFAVTTNDGRTYQLTGSGTVYHSSMSDDGLFVIYSGQAPASTTYLYAGIDGYFYGSNQKTVPLTSEAVACYCLGTSILTDHGEVAVENLAIGDRVVTHGGAVRPIKWIGRRSYGARFLARNRDLLPICFAPGSLGAGLPRRPLRVSPQHAMFLDGVLVPAASLLNGVTICRAEDVPEVQYFHVELDSHDILLAEGAASESFVDDDSRGIFNNAHEFAALYPAAGTVEAVYCAARVEDGERLERIRLRLDAIARRRSPVDPGRALRAG